MTGLNDGKDTAFIHAVCFIWDNIDHPISTMSAS